MYSAERHLVATINDLIHDYGVAAFDQAYQDAAILNSWKAKSYSDLTYPAALTVNQRYLGSIPIPDDAKLVCLKSAKGTGKTQLLEGIVQDAIANGRWVLVIGHRVQLVEALCQRFGIPYVTEVRTSDTGKTLGYGLCIDSLHPLSQARFTASGWLDGTVIIDESEQVLWQALNSSTCQAQRISILRELKTLLTNVLQGDGRLILSDADLSDVSIDFAQALAGVNVAPWVVVNEWKPGVNERWNIHNYTGTDPSGLVAELEKHIAGGGRPLVCCSSQKAKSSWGSRNLEAHLSQVFPGKRILRIDSESIADPSHPAFGVITDLNQELSNYDIVLSSPSLETGVSIDICGHFTSVWGIFQGVQTETSARQALSRLREPVPRHIWVAPYGIGRIGNGSTSIKSLLASQHKLTKANIRLLQDSALDDLDLDFQPEALRTWAKMAARVNLGMGQYTEAIVEGLKAEGHQIIEVGAVNDDKLKEAIATTKEALHTLEAVAIAAADDIDQTEFERLQDKKTKTQDERYVERKYSLGQRYAVPVTSDLVLKDDDGWYPQIRLHYFLTVGREFLPQRDRQRARSQVEQGSGAVFLPDFNRGQISAPVVLLEKLGVIDLLDGREFSGSDEALQRIAATVQSDPWTIKAVLGITVSPKDAPIAIVQKLLGKCGLSLTYLGRRGGRGQQQRFYKYIPLMDVRDDVFAAWFLRDEASVVTTPVVPTLVVTPGNKDIDIEQATTDPVVTPPEHSTCTSPPAPTTTEGAMVTCWRFGRMFAFRIESLVGTAMARIRSILTSEVFEVPVTELALWGGAA